jgi:hypothetical protein
MCSDGILDLRNLTPEKGASPISLLKGRYDLYCSRHMKAPKKVVFNPKFYKEFNCELNKLLCLPIFCDTVPTSTVYGMKVEVEACQIIT